jgi:hypothetical protein
MGMEMEMEMMGGHTTHATSLLAASMAKHRMYGSTQSRHTRLLAVPANMTFVEHAPKVNVDA